MQNQFSTPTPELRRSILAEYGEQYDRLVREKERRLVSKSLLSGTKVCALPAYTTKAVVASSRLSRRLSTL